MGAGAVVFAAGQILGGLKATLTTLSEAIVELRGDVKELGEKIHDIDKSHTATRTKLESLNGELGE